MKLSLLLTSALFASLVTPAAAVPPPPQADSVDVSVPTQLPRTAIPRHYAITVTPNAAKLGFDAKVAIDFNIKSATRTLVLNAADLSFRSAALKGATGNRAARISTEETTQTVTFDFGQTVQPGAYRLDVDYSGKINTQANGLFALDYKDKEGKDARALFTQFEAADARRFVPSWDEPDYKTTFDLKARVPAIQMAVSNMPATRTRSLDKGLKEVTFQTSPTMSSYLLFFALGDFDRIARKVGDREVGIVMSRGNADKAHYALDAEAQLLPYFDEYFGVPYALPKLDNVGGPGQSQFFGAMENWGAIFTFEKILLDDPAITTESDRQKIFSVQAHEMAHQWFGNLVTMAWWDDLWLNEGFASWMASRATQHFHPDWGADVDSVLARESAMALDAIKSTHPIVQDIRTVEQANQAFDNITYEKGEVVISMLEGFAGAGVWKSGIQAYMKKHAYQNTRTSDLWAAVEGAGAQGLSAVARDFTNQAGIPLISVGPAQCVGNRTVTMLTQTQFSVDDRVRVGAAPLSWHVPVRATAGGKPVQLITSGPTNRISVPGCGPLRINPGQTGYFRTLYQPDQAVALLRTFSLLSPVDQFGLMTEQLSLSNAGYQPMAVGLNILSAVPANGHAKVVEETLNRWSDVYDELDGQPELQTAIAARVTQHYGERLQQLGFAPRPGEAPVDTLLRPVLISKLGKFGDAGVLAQAQRLFAAWLSRPDAILGSLKGTWLGVVAGRADASTWEILHRRAQRASGAVERSTLYDLLGATKDPALARRTLELALTDEPGKTVSAGMIRSVASGHPRLTIDFVLSHLAQVNELIDISGRSRFMKRLVADSADASLIPSLEAYAKANLEVTDRAPVNQALDVIRMLSARAPRMRSEVGAWLAANPSQSHRRLIAEHNPL